MTDAVRPLAPDIWLALSLPDAPCDLVGRERRVADRRAALLARMLAHRAIALPRERISMSHSHSRGAGAAIAAPRKWAIGVDVVALGRVRMRHAIAVSDEDELEEMLADAGDADRHAAPALLWALKEAAAKAAGRSGALWPWRVRVAARGGVAILASMLNPQRTLRGGWLVAGEYLCAWVLDPSSGRSPV